MNFSDWPVWYYVIAGCGGLLLLAIILYFIPGGRIKISGMTSCGLISLVVGVGLGVVTMYGFGYHWESQPAKALASDGGGGRGGPGGGGGAPRGMGGGRGGEGKGKEGTNKNKEKDSSAKGGSEQKGNSGSGMPAALQKAMAQAGSTPPYKDQLVSLVARLDLLTSPTPLIKLTDDQKTKIREKLSGLDKDEIKDEEALQILTDLLEIVEDQRNALELAGFRHPGAGGEISRPSPNPFKYQVNANHLKALQERLTSKGGS